MQQNLSPPSEKIALLRQSLVKPALAQEQAFVRLDHDEIDQVLGGGLRLGALHEVYAPAGHETAATGFATGLAARLAQDKQILWIGQEFVWHEFGAPCPTGFFEFGLHPSRLMCLSVSNAQDALRASGDALTCKGLGAVVIELTGNPKILDLTASRRLVLAAAQNSIPIIFLRFGAGPSASAAETRWLVKAAASAPEDWGQPVFDVSLIRNRNGRMGQWVLSWSCDNACFKNAKAAFGAVVSTPANRQAEAA